MYSHTSGKYNGFSTKIGNYVWAGALTLAWKELADNLVKEPVKIESK